MLNTKANESIINTGDNPNHSGPKNNRIKKLLLKINANDISIEKIFI